MEEITTNKNNKSIKGKIIDIVSWVLVLSIFLSSLFLLITRKGDGAIQIFGHRYDVVLRNSMSTKNEKYLSFLEGTTQIQKMDVVRSEVINSHSELNIYDVVLFKDPKIGTNMHRIVDKKVHRQNEVYLQEATILDNGGISLSTHNASIYTNGIIFTKAVFEIQSKSPTFSNGYYFALNNSSSPYELETTSVGEFYRHKITIANTNTYRTNIQIVHSQIFDYGSELFTKISIDSSLGNIDIGGGDFIATENNIYQFFNHTTYLYEIRGDASNTSDGWFEIEAIYSRVDKIVPKAGYFVRYITSIPGIIMLIGIGLIIIVADYFLDYFDKKDKNPKKTMNTQ